MATKPKALCQAENCHPGLPCSYCVTKLGLKRAYALSNKWKEDIEKEQPQVEVGLKRLQGIRSPEAFIKLALSTPGGTVWFIDQMILYREKKRSQKKKES